MSIKKNKINADRLFFVDFVTETASDEANITGLGSREKNATHVWRRMTEKGVQATFVANAGRKLRLFLRLNDRVLLQGLTVKINGDVVDIISQLGQSGYFQKEYDFESLPNNVINLAFKSCGNFFQAFLKNPRQCLQKMRGQTIRVYDFMIKEADATPFPRLKAKFIGKPLENAQLAQREYEEGKTVLESLPPVVTFALTTLCNYSHAPCLICDRHTRPAGSDREASVEVIAAVEPLLKTATCILLHCGGEAMFSRHFDQMISVIHPPTRVAFATNAMLMTPQRTEKMLARDIMAGIEISLDAATPEIYHLMRPAGKFDRVIEHIRYYTRRTKELKREFSSLFLNMTVCQANVEDIPKLVDLALEVGAQGVSFNHLNSGMTHKVLTTEGWRWDYAEQEKFKDPARHDQLLLEAYQRVKKNNLGIHFVGTPFIGLTPGDQDIKNDLMGLGEISGTENNGWKSSFHKPFGKGIPSCFKPWQETVIQPDGDVRACYFHELGDWTIGNVCHVGDFMQIWNSETMARERKSFLENCFSKRCAVSIPCKHRGRK